jgi:hypothetical protein
LRQLGDGGRTIVHPPFVLGGDLGEAVLEEWHGKWIAPAARAMAAAYFTEPPRQPVTILLFSGEAAYRDQARRLLGETTISSHGFYRPHLRLIVTHIGHGPGPLMHELTHALMAFDFPDAPDWFREGLASLHERAEIRADGRDLDGLDNERLPLLQAAIRQRQLPSLGSFLVGEDFLGRRETLNYAYARYLCLYLQRRGLLGDYYRRFRNGRREDPRGEKTLAIVFPGRSLAALESNFCRWVTELQP